MKMHEGQSVYEHCLIMIKNLEKLELTMQKKLQVDLIQQFLTSSYSQFIINFHMNKLDYTLSELVNMLVTTEGTLKSSKDCSCCGAGIFQEKVYLEEEKE